MADGVAGASGPDDQRVASRLRNRLAASGREWTLRPFDLRTAEAIAQTFELDFIVAQILSARGVSAENAERYLAPSLRSDMPDPSVLKDMDKAADRIAAAISNGETIGVFGDYDVDGVTASALLKNYFDAVGAHCVVRLPDREGEGYGPSEAGFDDLRKAGATLIITVDCGAAAHDIVNQFGEAADIVIFDHHQMDDAGPERAFAVVNPNRPDDVSGLTILSAVGVAFMGLAAVNRSLRETYNRKDGLPDLRRFLDLVALGAVCDVMPLQGLSRTIVAQGLKVLGRENPGLSALLDKAGAKGALSTYHLGFILGPRVNAAGRIGHANLAFKLLTTEDAGERERLADRLNVLNAERQTIEADVLEQAIRDIELHQRQADPVIVAAGRDWHPGVVGIVAGRLKDRYDRPAVVIGVDKNNIGKGSARSLSGVDIGAAIIAARKEGLLTSGGGHAAAAGLTLDALNIERLRDYLKDTLSDDVERALNERRLKIDALIDANAITASFVDMLAAAGPFGAGNPEPVFAVADLAVRSPRIVGEKHLALELCDRMGATVRAIAFRAVGGPIEELLRSGERVNVAGKIRKDDWRGGDAAQLQLEDVALRRD